MSLFNCNTGFDERDFLIVFPGRVKVYSQVVKKRTWIIFYFDVSLFNCNTGFDDEREIF